MNKKDNIKKPWVRPAVHTLDIKKDTFAGSTDGLEKGQNFLRPGPPADPTPR